jgi:Fe-S cluster biogenesis protein NfuA
MLDALTAAARELAPDLGLDPAALRVTAFADGIATVAVGEACASCPATLPLLVAQLEAGLRERFPDVEIVQAVT